MRRVVVLGIGNTLLTDEAVGARVLDALRDRAGFDGVDLVDGGTLSFTLLDYVESAVALIVVDAGNVGAPPGSVHSFEGAAMDAFLSGPGRQRSVHEVGLLDLLSVARLHQVLPERRALVCVQPERIGWGLSLSPPVEAAVPAAAAEVLRLLRRWQA
jgi:hydrogenase maturation protease